MSEEQEEIVSRIGFCLHFLKYHGAQGEGCSDVQGKLAATAVNAPMVPAEVLAELQPYVALAQVLNLKFLGVF